MGQQANDPHSKVAKRRVQADVIQMTPAIGKSRTCQHSTCHKIKKNQLEFPTVIKISVDEDDNDKKPYRSRIVPDPSLKPEQVTSNHTYLFHL